MRIAPVGLAFRNATPTELQQAVKWAVTHPRAYSSDRRGLPTGSLAVRL